MTTRFEHVCNMAVYLDTYRNQINQRIENVADASGKLTIYRINCRHTIHADDIDTRSFHRGHSANVTEPALKYSCDDCGRIV
jgi:hypothetical protein